MPKRTKKTKPETGRVLDILNEHFNNGKATIRRMKPKSKYFVVTVDKETYDLHSKDLSAKISSAGYRVIELPSERHHTVTAPYFTTFKRGRPNHRIGRSPDHPFTSKRESVHRRTHSQGISVVKLVIAPNPPKNPGSFGDPNGQ